MTEVVLTALLVGVFLAIAILPVGLAIVFVAWIAAKLEKAK